MFGFKGRVTSGTFMKEIEESKVEQGGGGTHRGCCKMNNEISSFEENESLGHH